MPSKEKKLLKKEKKTKEKRIKELKDILSWMEIEKIDQEGIFLKKGSTERIVKGYRLEPFNVLIADNMSKAKAIISWASGLDKDKFPIYYKFIKSTPRLQYQQTHLAEAEKIEENSGIRNLIRMQMEKMDWFCENQSEVAFYVIVQDDLDHIDKRLDQLYYTFSGVGLNPIAMNTTDYEAVVKEQYENEIVNEYMFSCLVHDNEVYENEIK